MLAVNTIDPVPSRSAGAPEQHATGLMLAIAKDKDKSAFEELYALYAPRIKHYMVGQGADNATADDLAQETMVQVWRKAEQYDPQKAVPSAWIYRISRNLRIDKLRRRKFHEVELTAEADKPDEGWGDHEHASERVDAERIRHLVRDLPGEQMEIVNLAFFQGLSHSEIGQRLSIPLGTVKSRLRLAFGKLRTALGEQA